MEHRIRRDSALITLVSEFETNYENGNIEYLSDKVFFKLIGYYEGEQEYEKALDVAKIALQQFKYRSDFYISMARVLLKVGAVDECLEHLAKAQTIAPCETDLITLKVKALAISGEYQAAFHNLEILKQNTLDGDLIDVYLCEAEIYSEMNNHSERFNILKKAIQVDNRNIEALSRFWSATELSRRYIECAGFMKSMIDKDPYNSIAWFNLGHAMSMNGEYQDAIDAIEYAFLIDPDFETAYIDCADLCCQIKDFDRALNIYQDAISRFGEGNDLLIKLAECQMYLNKVKLSKTNLYKAIKQDPYNDEVYFFLGECFSKEEKWYSAINAYHKAIEIEENVGEYYLGVARAYVAVEDYNKATVNFHLAVSDGPEQTHFWMEFASFLMKMGLHEEAIRILDEAEDYTFGADLLYCRAVANFFLKNKVEALQYLKEALLEDYSLHTIIYVLAPELQVDKEISSMLTYYAGE